MFDRAGPAWRKSTPSLSHFSVILSRFRAATRETTRNAMTPGGALHNGGRGLYRSFDVGQSSA